MPDQRIASAPMTHWVYYVSLAFLAALVLTGAILALIVVQMHRSSPTIGAAVSGSATNAEQSLVGSYAVTAVTEWRSTGIRAVAPTLVPAAPGASNVAVTFNADGTYQTTVPAPGPIGKPSTTAVERGTYHVDGTTIVFQNSEAPRSSLVLRSLLQPNLRYTYQVHGSALLLTTTLRLPQRSSQQMASNTFPFTLQLTRVQ